MTQYAQRMQRWIPGLLGIAWRTDLAYYRMIHELGSRLLEGGAAVNSMKTSMYTVDFVSLIDKLRRGERAGIQAELARASQSLRASGADFLVVPANTFHAFLDEIRSREILPILDITQVVCIAAAEKGYNSIGLLSTSMTLEEKIYQNTAATYGMNVLTLPPELVTGLDKIIFEELISGIWNPESIDQIRGMIDWMAKHGADCVVLACTDLTHVADLLNPSPITILDSTKLHAHRAVQLAYEGKLVL